MKKIFILSFSLIMLFVFTACGKEPTSGTEIDLFQYKEPTSETVIDLIHKAEAIYHLGSKEVLKFVNFPSYPLEEYPYYMYDEIINYEEAVSTVFTENAKNILEQASVLVIPTIFKKDNRVYRVAYMCDSDATTYFNTIRSLKLIEQQDNKFIYEVVHVQELGGFGYDPSTFNIDEAPDITSYVTIIYDGENYLIDEFKYPGDFSEMN